MRTVSETSGTTLNTPTFELQGCQKKKGTEKIFEEIIVENFPNMGKEIVNQVQEAQRVPYRRLKEKHAEININQTKKIKYKIGRASCRERV